MNTTFTFTIEFNADFGRGVAYYEMLLTGVAAYDAYKKFKPNLDKIMRRKIKEINGKRVLSEQELKAMNSSEWVRYDKYYICDKDAPLLSVMKDFVAVAKLALEGVEKVKYSDIRCNFLKIAL